jgi:hypothetical protein
MIFTDRDIGDVWPNTALEPTATALEFSVEI